MTLDQAVQNYVYHRRKAEQCSLRAIREKFGLGTTDNVRRICNHKKRHKDEELIWELNDHYDKHLKAAGKRADLAAAHGISFSKLEKLIRQESERYQ